MECSDNIGLKDSRERGKRGCLYTLLVIMGLLMVFVGYVVYYNVHYEEIMDKRGLELVAKIDAFKKENGRLPENLGELGLKQWSDGAYKYRGGVFYYEQKRDSTYTLEYLLDFDTNKSYNQETGKWEF